MCVPVYTEREVIEEVWLSLQEPLSGSCATTEPNISHLTLSTLPIYLFSLRPYMPLSILPLNEMSAV